MQTRLEDLAIEVQKLSPKAGDLLVISYPQELVAWPQIQEFLYAIDPIDGVTVVALPLNKSRINLYDEKALAAIGLRWIDK